ncbi:MAG: thioredoxin [Clostridia bacterium]|nr:thioredoxin [Clostridia bacterium]
MIEYFLTKSVNTKRKKETEYMSVITITEQNFEQEVLQSDKPVLLDFWAPWCGPCRMVSPIVDQIATERGDVKVGKVNVDEQPNLAAQFDIMSIPMLMVFKNGALYNKALGAQPKGKILELLS